MKIPLYRSKNRRYLIFAFASLLVGIVSTITISKYLIWEYQTDQFFTDSEKIFFAANQMSPVSNFDEAEIRGYDWEDITQVSSKASTRFYWEAQLEYENEKYKGICLVADSTFFKIFDYSLRLGNLETVLSDPKDIILTAQYAERIFGKNDPQGKSVKVYTDNSQDYKVAGVIDVPPGNSTMKFDYIVPSHSIPQGAYWGRMGMDWVKLNNENDKVDVDKQLAEKYPNSTLKLIPLSGAYFDFSFELMPAKQGDRKHTQLLLVILILVFSLSLFNFFSPYMLLNTNRKKELGIKKILGADNSNLFKTFFVENFLMCFAAFGISIILFAIMYPLFIKLTGKSFVFQLGNDGLLLASFFVIVLIIMVLWSVFFSSRISPLLSSNYRTKSYGWFTPFKIITVLQYSISITLLIVTFSLFRQLNYMKNQDLNFSCENVIGLNFFSPNPFIFSASSDPNGFMDFSTRQRTNRNLLENELASSPLIVNYCYGQSPFNNHSMNWKKRGEDEYLDGNIISITPGYENVFELEIKEGRFFNKELDHDRVQRVVINEAAVRYFGIDNITTDKLINSSWGDYEIIGVVKDFHAEHLSRPISPLIIVYFDDIEDDWFIRYTPDNEAEILAYLKELHSKVSPGEEFTYSFMEDELAAIYKNDRIQVKIYTILTLLALFISLMGIAALSLHHAFKRTRETAIRKVNGCSIGEAVYEMIYPYITLVVISFGIASLAGQYFVADYLENFANRLPINYGLFAAAGAIVLIVSALILFVALFNAAKQNPVDSIKVE